MGKLLKTVAAVEEQRDSLERQLAAAQQANKPAMNKPTSTSDTSGLSLDHQLLFKVSYFEC